LDYFLIYQTKRSTIAEGMHPAERRGDQPADAPAATERAASLEAL